MLSITNLNKSFGGQTLFKDASLIINPGERVGLIGRNGFGKTTLFNMIAGEEAVGETNIVTPKNYKISYLKQNIVFKKNTVLEECISVLESEDEQWIAEKILFGLGFKEFMEFKPSELSGGFQIRLNLAKLLLSKSNMLLLDEPNNYLDINSLEWLEGFLKNYDGEILLITHDRAFMDGVVSHIAGINRYKIKKINGTTSKYYNLIDQEEEIHEKTRLNQEKKIKQTQEFIDKFRAKARQANMVQSRIKALEKTQILEKLTVDKNLNFRFKEAEFSGKYTLNVKKVNFAYNKNVPLIKDLDFHALYGEKICVIGKNGKGKTTLLKIIKGLLKSTSSDEFSIHPNVVFGYFEQSNVVNLNDDFTVLDEVLYSTKEMDIQTARNICGMMMFEGDNALKKISVLSGGEKCRVLLAKILASRCNFLLLDEPTNHLDMDACNSFLDAVKYFKGTVVLVTHNEYFLKTLAEKLIVFKEDETFFFDGDYENFLDKIGWEDEFIKNKSKSSKNNKREKAELQQSKSKVLNPLQEEILLLENQIKVLEKELETINQDILTASINKNGELIPQLNIKNKENTDKVERLYTKLEPILVSFEEAREKFDIKLKVFDDEK